MLLSMLNGHSTLTKHILYFFGLRWLHWNFSGVLLSLESQVRVWCCTELSLKCFELRRISQHTVED